jgi:DNA modification methylase
MKRDRLPIEQVRFAPYNTRKMRKNEFRKLVESIKTYECYEPLIVNSENWHVVGGNQRLRALVKLGYKEVDVVIVSLSLDKEKLLNLALNRIQGEWDFDKLPILIEELSKISDIDLSLSGFDSGEVDKFLEGLREPKDPDDFDFDAAVASIKEPITKRGDVIQLGSHRIMCGDSALESDMDILMQSEKIGLVQIDPPYGCFYLAQNRPDLEARPKKSKRWDALYKDNLSEEEYEVWIKNVLSNIRRYLEDGASAYIWNGHAKFYFVHQVLKELGFHISTVITWAKPTFAISYGDYNQQTEFCIFSWLSNGPHKWYGPTNESNLWEVARDKASQLIHPTQKSVLLPARAIRNSSVRGDVVFDGFLGSGSSLIAAESLGRHCYGMEIEPKYIDGIVRRYITFVGKENVSEDIVRKYLKEESNAK